MALPPWRKGIVTRIEEEAPLTNRYFIEIPELDNFEFLPGQFVTFDLPIGEKNSERWRSYSIASAPDGSNSFELIIVQAQGGRGTEYMFENWKVGSEMTVRGPQGKFTLPETLDKNLYLICTGTGIAPFRSMVKHIIRHRIPHQQIFLVFGCRQRCDLLYYNEMRALENAEKNFNYLPTLSREDWEGHKGYVHAVYKELLADRPPAYFFLCGWKNMIDDARKMLQELGYDKKDIHFELYG